MDIRILIDVSGSMKKTDPNNLRIPALQLLTQLLPHGSRAGVWEFANHPKVIVPMGLVDAQWQKKAAMAAQNISAKGKFTNIGSALKAAAFSQQDQTSGRQLHLILLTDGMVDVSTDVEENQRARRTLLEPILQQYIDMGVRVHTIGLSHQSDEQTLRTMAHLTDGLFEVAENGGQLLDIFLQELDNTVITQQVPIQLDEQTFKVDANLESMTIIIEQNGDQHIKLRDGHKRLFGKHQTLANQQWQSSSTHDVISIQQPVAGTWALVSPTAKLKRVNVVGLLQILLQQSHQNIKVGQRAYIDVQLANEQDILLTENQLYGFELSVQMMLDGEQISSQQKVFLADKKTRVHLPVLEQDGMYDLNISVVKGRLVREISRNLRVHPLVSVSLSEKITPIQISPTKDIIVAVEKTATIIQQRLVISTEQASSALQTLMQTSSATPELIPDTYSLTTSEQIAQLVNSSGMSAVIEARPNDRVIPPKVPEEPLDFSPLRWLVVIGVSLLFFILLLFYAVRGLRPHNLKLMPKLNKFKIDSNG